MRLVDVALSMIAAIIACACAPSAGSEMSLNKGPIPNISPQSEPVDCASP